LAGTGDVTAVEVLREQAAVDHVRGLGGVNVPVTSADQRRSLLGVSGFPETVETQSTPPADSLCDVRWKNPNGYAGGTVIPPGYQRA